MRPLTLLIAGQVADLPTSTKGLVKLSQARASLSDVAARVGEYSFPFALPATQTNAAIFGPDRLHPLGLRKFGLYTDFACELRVGGQVLAGTFRLTSLKNGYTGSFIGAGFSWALLLGESKLTDLVFAPVAYDGSQLEQTLGRNCDSTDLQFPLVAYGNFFAPPTSEIQPDGSTKEVPAPPAAVLDYPLSVDDYPPSVYLVNVIRQVFASIGWQVQGRELDSDFWRSVVVLPAGADVAAAWNWGTLLKARQFGPASCFTYYDDAAGNYTNSAQGADLDELGEVMYLPLAASQGYESPTRALDPVRASFTAPRTGVYRFEWEATLSSGNQQWLLNNPTNSFQQPFMQPVGLGLVVRRGGQDWSGADGGLVTSNTQAYLPGQDRVLTPRRLDVPGTNYTALQLGAYQGSTGDVYLEAGDVLMLATFARRRLLNVPGGYAAITRTSFTTDWTGVVFACVGYADENGLSKELLQPADFLPPLLCRDLVKEFLLRTNSFILPEVGRQLATILSRDELSEAARPALDLTGLVDSRTVEYLPAAGGSFVFAPAALSDDPLVSPTADVVLATVGAGESSQQVSSLFAPVGLRPVQLPNGLGPLLPTCSTKDVLSQNRSETQPDPGSQAPRLLRYVGPDAGQPVPFMLREVPLGRAAWDGVLAWDGAAGAVGTYYQGVLRRAVSGHLARVSVPLSPAQYVGLRPGRRVLLAGAGYTVATCQNYDPADEAGLCSLELDREVQ